MARRIQFTLSATVAMMVFPACNCEHKDDDEPDLTTLHGPDLDLSFWSVAVILMICVLVSIFIFLFLTDFCCELHLCLGSVTFFESQGSPSDLLGRMQPSAPPAEKEDKSVLKDTVMTIEGVELMQDHWTDSYFNFCRKMSRGEDNEEGGNAYVLSEPYSLPVTPSAPYEFTDNHTRSSDMVTAAYTL